MYVAALLAAGRPQCMTGISDAVLGSSEQLGLINVPRDFRLTERTSNLTVGLRSVA